MSSVPTLQVLQDVLERGGGADREHRGRNEGSGENVKCANQIYNIISYKHHSQGLPSGRENLGGGENEAK